MKKLLTFILLSCLLTPVLSFASGSYSGGGFQSARPSELSAAAYKKGLKQFDLASTVAKEAKEAADKKQKKLIKKSQRLYRKSIRNFKVSIEHVPSFFQSHLGLAYSRLGEFGKAAPAFRKVLSLNAKYYPAVGLLAESHMHLRNFNETKKAYSQLLEVSPEYAQQLFSTISAWLSLQDINSDADLKKFSDWFQSLQ